MKERTYVQGLSGLAVLTLILAMWLGARSRSFERAIPPSASAAAKGVEGPASFRSTVSGSPSANPFWRRSPFGWSRRAPAPTEVRVYAGQTLALVNQTPVQLRHLTPVRPGDSDKVLTPEEYHSRLERAIETELTFQAARAQGVELTAAQKQRLEQIAARHQTDLAHYQKYGLSWSSITSVQVEFEKRLLSAQMLEQNLVARKADVSPSPDPAEQAHYEQARRELFDQLLAGANIAGTGSAQ